MKTGGVLWLNTYKAVSILINLYTGGVLLCWIIFIGKGEREANLDTGILKESREVISEGSGLDYFAVKTEVQYSREHLVFAGPYSGHKS